MSLRGLTVDVCRGDDTHSLFPCLGDLIRQMKGVDARMVFLDFSPEAAGQDTSQGAKGVVVQHGAAFVEVSDENITDRATADVIVVDQFRGRSLAAPQCCVEREARRCHPDHAEQVPGGV